MTDEIALDIIKLGVGFIVGWLFCILIINRPRKGSGSMPGD